MKKPIIKLITLGLILIITSCSKNDNFISQSKENQISKLTEDLLQINSKFSGVYKPLLSGNLMSLGSLQPEPGNHPPLIAFSFKKLCGVISADVGGAWAGAWAGGKIGALFGNPGVGAAVGGIVVGGMASYAASYATPIPNKPEPELFSLDTLNVGKGHNDILFDLTRATPHIPVTGSGVNLLNNIQLSSDQSVIVSNCSSLINETYSFFKKEPSILLSKKFVSEKIEDDYITTVSNQFFSGMENLTSTEDFRYYIDNYAQYVNATELLTKAQKQNILNALAVAKSSLRYWSTISAHQ